MDMEVGESQEKRWAITWGGFMEELKKTGRIAAPMVAVSVLQYLLQVVSTVMVGHLSQLALSSVAIATSLTNVTGFSLLSGMAGGLETLCGQAYGAAQFRKLGVHTYTAIISLILVCPLVCLLWIFMDKLLPLIGQDPVISHEARKYSMWLIPALFGSAILKPLTRYFQTQSLILPMFASSFLILCFHIPACWTLVFKLELGSMGAALAFSLSTWLNVILLGLYMMYSSACEKTRAPVSKESLLAIGQFFRLAIPSAIMVCLKWWSMEILILLSGLLPNPKLETSVLSICLTISTLHFTIPYAFGVAASTRVSNELGAGNLQAARVAVWAATSYAVVEAVIVGTILFSCRYFLGYAYTKDNQVAHYVAVMAPLICLSVITDSLQAVFSGVAKGCGWQHRGVYINLGAFYLVGLPVGAVLGFVAHLRGKGLWIGIVAGSVVQSTLLSLATTFTNWKKQILILLSGLLPNSKLETSVLSICLNISSTHYFIPYGIGAAASTRVSNELGAGNPQAAQLAACVVMILAVTEAVIVGTILFCCCYVLAYAFNSDKDVVNYVSELVPLLSFSIIMDSLQSVLSGVARGTGWQHIGAYVNLGAYYIVGIPLASVLCFVLSLRGKGLWIGIMTGSAVQAIVLAIITVTTNWRKQARMARERIFEGTCSAGNRSV